MTPITWRNVNSKSNNDAAYLMRGAQEGITGGLDRVAGVVKGIEQNQQDNYNIVKDNNTNAFKDMMAGFSSEEELNAAVQSGAVQRMADSFGYQADQDVLRNGVKNREESLRSSLTADQQFGQQQQTYQDSQKTRELRGVTDELTLLSQQTGPGSEEAWQTAFNAAMPSLNKLGLGAQYSEANTAQNLKEQTAATAETAQTDAASARQSGLNLESNVASYLDDAQVTYTPEDIPDFPQVRADARAYMAQFKPGDEGYMNLADQETFISKLSTGVESLYGITQEQVKLATTAQDQQQIKSTANVKRAQNVYDRTIADAPVDDMLSFTDQPRNATDIMYEKNWDPTDWGLGGDLNEVMIDVRKDWIASNTVNTTETDLNGNLLKDEDGKIVKVSPSADVVDNIMAIVARDKIGQGSENKDDYFKRNVNPTLFKDQMTLLYKEYETNNKNKRIQSEAERTLTAATQQADEAVSAAYTDNISKYRASNRNINSINPS